MGLFGKGSVKAVNASLLVSQNIDVGRSLLDIWPVRAAGDLPDTDRSKGGGGRSLSSVLDRENAALTGVSETLVIGNHGNPAPCRNRLQPKEDPMANLLTRLTTVRIAGAPATEARVAEVLGRKKIVEPDASSAPDHASESRVSIFVNPQTLTFVGAVTLVKGGWEGLKHTPLPGMATTWFPFIACLLIGATITVNNLRAQKTKGMMFGLGLFIGLLNSLVMFVAVLGLSK